MRESTGQRRPQFGSDRSCYRALFNGARRGEVEVVHSLGGWRDFRVTLALVATGDRAICATLLLVSFAGDFFEQ